MVHGRRHGRGVVAADSGRSSFEGVYVDGKKDGRWLETCADARKEGDYVNDKKQGRWVETYADGRSEEGGYAAGARNGPWTGASADGLRWTGVYVNGDKHGQWTEPSADGARWAGVYKKGKKHGVWIDSRDNGDMWAQTWNNGKNGEIKMHKDSDLDTSPHGQAGCFSYLFPCLSVSEQPGVEQLLSKEEIRKMRDAAREEVPVGDTKIFEPVYKLKTGLPVFATRGLEDRMSVQGMLVEYHERIAKGMEGIQEEVNQFAAGSTNPDVMEVRDLLHYIRFEPTGEKRYKNGIRDHRRGVMRLVNFLQSPKAIAAGLNEAELVAMRLYTTSAFQFMNRPLRDDKRYERNESCPLPVTTYFADKGIKKMRALHVPAGGGSLAAAEEVLLWRGMRNLEAADDFMKQGGTELAFMSTTKDLSVAVRYCLSKQSLLFKIVSDGFMTMGADVQWLSAFPGEAEILYPPLTYLKPTGRSQMVEVERDGQRFSFNVVEVRPQLA